MNVHDKDKDKKSQSGRSHAGPEKNGHDDNAAPDTVMRVGDEAMIEEQAAAAREKAEQPKTASSHREKARHQPHDHDEPKQHKKPHGTHNHTIDDDDLVSATDSAAFAGAVRDEPAAEAKPDAASRDTAEGEGLAAGEETFEQVRAERDAYLDLARRERADFDNYRKRVEREMKAIKRESLADFLKEFFGPLDDMDRVLQESVKNHSFESLVTGVRIMEENFWRVLAKVGVRKIDAKGKTFDPNLHEAMMAVPSSDVPPGTVVEVYDNGYKLDEFVLRPARVVVSRAPDE
ncbi:MAG: nucleotide exchange factor GrpE [Planctomycetaceae bacterium]|nr:nucleotide exchange factor GrpE [Planctomycetaceae bacterium]